MMDKQRLKQIELSVINFFKECHTNEGNDYVSLTALGIERLGLEQTNVADEVTAMPHPPKSATKAM